MPDHSLPKAKPDWEAYRYIERIYIKTYPELKLKIADSSFLPGFIVLLNGVS